MLLSCVALLLSPALAAPATPTATPAPAYEPVAPDFLALVHPEARIRRAALRRITADFDVAQVPMALELLRFQTRSDVVDRLWRWLVAGVDVELADREAAYEWLWAQDYTPSPDYLSFKAALYGAVDPRFRDYFRPGFTWHVRADEVRWGGVRQDGIPPLRDPWLQDADQASWLADDDVVFGLVIDGEARAYPKRILAWHELLTDRIGDTDIVAVYCTLCGSMIAYGTQVDGARHVLGTSGFLYRSNKLMYDAATSSLWSTLGGRPVAGPLADSGIELPMYPVVTTTWGAWRQRHAGTRVLSLHTGHDRDYREGAAYRRYFATDALMFTVPDHDPRLANKDEVLALRAGDDRLALSVRFLARHPVHHDTAGGQRVVILTDPSGASRVYAAGEHTFASLEGDRVLDTHGVAWTLTEAGLEGPGGSLPRLPAHRAFWFGWHAAWPETRLVR